MGSHRRLIRILAAAAVLVLTIAPSATGKKKHKGKSKTLVVTTATASASATPPGAPPYFADLAATATCPPGNVAIGGGFYAPHAPQPGLFHFFDVADSMRVGETQWLVRGIAAFQNAGASPQTLTVEAYCAAATVRLTDVAVAAVLGGANFDAATPVASCPPGQRLVSGGFSSPAGVAPISLGIVQESAPLGGAWSVRIVRTGTGPSGTATAHAYCFKPPKTKKKRRKKAHPHLMQAFSSTQTVPADFTSAATATTGACPPNRLAVGGGFSAGAIAGTAAAYPIESRSVSGVWRVTEVQGGAPGAPIPITAFNGCV